MAKKRTSENERAVSPGVAHTPGRHTPAAAPHMARTLANPVSEPLAEPAPAMAAGYTPKREDIAALAYSYWVAGGRQSGSAEGDWLRAEGELRHARTTAASK